MRLSSFLFRVRRKPLRILIRWLYIRT